MKNIKTVLSIIICTYILSSCASYKKTLYLQDTVSGDVEVITKQSQTAINIDDKLSIIVTCSNPEAALAYNTPMLGVSAVTRGTITTSSSENIANGYTVNSDGKINFPELGEIYVKGMTKDQLGKYLEEHLQPLLKDPIVIVQYMNFKVSIMGDVKQPQIVTIKSGRLTVLEALSRAGDLNTLARRKTVLVIREKDGQRSFERLDLTSKKIFESEYYYLQQNDVVYIEPSKAGIFSTGSAATTFSAITALVAILTLAL